MKIFYCTKYSYSIGDKLSPGRWRYFVEQQSWNNINVLLELAFENSRKLLNDTSLVSRLDCIYGFTNATDAENFATNEHKIYELKFDRENTPFSLHNYKIYSYFLGQLAQKPNNILKEQQLFTNYWTNNASVTISSGFEIPQTEEIHIGGQAEVIRIF